MIDDPRLVPVTGSAADVEKILADRGLGAADYVLSGLPFSTLPPGVGEAIATATAKVIRAGGAFLVYQFSPKVLNFIKPHFEPIERGFEWVNVPPATLFWAYKGEPGGLASAAEVEAPGHRIIHDVDEEVGESAHLILRHGVARRLCSWGVILCASFSSRSK